MDKIAQIVLPMLEGSEITLQIFLITFLLVLPLGLLIALGHIARFRPLRLPDIMAALLAFTLNYAAYFSEIFRAGIQSIDRGQYEAARMLGLTYGQTMRRIVIPQMIRRVLPPMSNETINLVKDTSLIYILAMNDLLRVARSIVQREFDMTPFVVAGVFYLAMTFVLTWGFGRLEAHFAKYDA